MRETSDALKCMGLRSDGACDLKGCVKLALDQELAHLPRGEVSEQDTRYPTDGVSMRAFLEVFFTRHLFQLQNSLIDYVTSDDFIATIQAGSLHILDIGSGPAVASQALIDMIHRMMSGACSGIWQSHHLRHMAHVLNDTSTICLTTGKHMLSACCRGQDEPDLVASRPQVFTLSSAFPTNRHQISRLASHSGGVDAVILSYVLRPLIENGSLQSLVCGMKTLEGFCKPRGRILIVQDKFQEQHVRELAGMIGVECREQTVTQKIYPPRGANEVCTYSYYDCLYAPRTGQLQMA